jgi:hypothetical protein
MFKVPMQNLFGAGLLLTLAFSVNDHSAAPDQNEAQAEVQLACDDGGFSPATPNSQRGVRLCRETDFR